MNSIGRRQILRLFAGAVSTVASGVNLGDVAKAAGVGGADNIQDLLPDVSQGSAGASRGDGCTPYELFDRIMLDHRLREDVRRQMREQGTPAKFRFRSHSAVYTEHLMLHEVRRTRAIYTKITEDRAFAEKLASMLGVRLRDREDYPQVSGRF